MADVTLPRQVNGTYKYVMNCLKYHTLVYGYFGVQKMYDVGTFMRVSAV
jgi:hypothetical protein